MNRRKFHASRFLRDIFLVINIMKLWKYKAKQVGLGTSKQNPESHTREKFKSIFTVLFAVEIKYLRK